MPEKLCTEEFYDHLMSLAWSDSDTLLQKTRMLHAQLVLLRSIHLTEPEYFFEMFTYSTLADFNNEFEILAWIKFDPAEVINLESIEAPKPAHSLAKNMKIRFPGTKTIYNYGGIPPTGLEDPNYVPQYSLESALMYEKLGFGPAHVSYTHDRQANYLSTVTTDPSKKKPSLWAGNPNFTGSDEYDAMSVLQQMRAYTRTPEKFPYVLGKKGAKGSFADLIKKIANGNVNLLQSPLKMANIWHISGAKDCLFEGALEWLEMIIPLVKPENLNTEQKAFFDLVQQAMPKVINGYSKLNEKLKLLAEINKKGERLSDYQLKQIIFFLIQHFPLTKLGNYLEERKTKLPNISYPNEFPALFKKAIKMDSTFGVQNPDQSLVVSENINKTKGKKRRADSQTELLEYAKRHKEKQRQKNKKRRANKKKKKGKGDGKL